MAQHPHAAGHARDWGVAHATSTLQRGYRHPTAGHRALWAQLLLPHQLLLLSMTAERGWYGAHCVSVVLMHTMYSVEESGFAPLHRRVTPPTTNPLD